MIKKFDVLLSVLAQGVSAISVFALSVVIGRFFGVHGTALFFQGLLLASVGSVVARLGLDNVITRYSSVYVDNGDIAGLKEMIVVVLKAVLIAGFVVSAFMMLGVFLLRAEKHLLWMVAAIPFLALSAGLASTLRGGGKASEFTFIQSGLVPMIVVCLTFVSMYFSESISVYTTFTCYILAVMTVFLIASWRVYRWLMVLYEKKKSLQSESIHWLKVWGDAKNLYVVSLLNLAVFPWAGIFSLSMFGMTDDVAFYGVGNQVANVLSLILVSVGNVYASKFAILYSRGDTVVLEHNARVGATLVFIVALLMAAFIVSFGENILGIFGHDFEIAYPILLILLGSQLVNAFTGNVGMLLMMTGYEKEVRISLVFSASALVVALMVLVPVWGGVGAAWASLIAMLVQNSSLAYFSVYKLKINPLPMLRPI